MLNNDRNGEAVLDSSLITLPELNWDCPTRRSVEFDDEDNEKKTWHPSRRLALYRDSFLFSHQKSENIMDDMKILKMSIILFLLFSILHRYEWVDLAI